MRDQVVAALERMNNLKEFISNMAGYVFLYSLNISLKQTNFVTEKGTVSLFPKWNFSKTECMRTKLRPG